MGKTVRMRIYKVHDYDLLVYYESIKHKDLGNPQASFSRLMAELLARYSKDGQIPDGQSFLPKVSTFYTGRLRSTVYVRFTVNDPASLAVLSKIKARQVNSFLKQLVRRSMPVDALPMSCYFDSDVAENVHAKVDVQAKVNAQTGTFTQEKVDGKALAKNRPGGNITDTPGKKEGQEKQGDSQVSTAGITEPMVHGQPVTKPVAMEPATADPEPEFDLFSALGSIM